MADADLTAQQLRELLNYDPQTGLLTWRAYRNGRALAGAVAGAPRDSGHIVVGIEGKYRPAHRLAWLHFYGEWPKQHIDHINGKPDDNRIANLRDIPMTLNVQNQRGPQVRNTTGFLGVTKRGKRFGAEISINGKSCKLGSFDTAEAAHAAYLIAKREHHAACTI
jgi:hypothetical protein